MELNNDLCRHISRTLFCSFSRSSLYEERDTVVFVCNSCGKSILIDFGTYREFNQKLFNAIAQKFNACHDRDCSSLRRPMEVRPNKDCGNWEDYAMPSFGCNPCDWSGSSAQHKNTNQMINQLLQNHREMQLEIAMLRQDVERLKARQIDPMPADDIVRHMSNAFPKG